MLQNSQMQAGSKLLIAAVGLLVLLLAAACGSPDPTATPTTAPATPTPTATTAMDSGDGATPTPMEEPTPTPTPQAGFEQEWEALIAAAQAEGRVVIAAGGAPSREYRPVVAQFGNKFGIAVELSTGSGADTTDRVLAERSAGRYAVDIGLTSVAATRTRLMPGEAIDPIPSLLTHPEVTDTSEWFKNRHWYADIEEQRFSFIYAVAPAETLDVWFNTDKIPLAEVEAIDDPWDLLDPKFAGMITSRTWGDRGRVGTMQTIYDQPGLGIEWITQFFNEMNPIYSDDARLREAWVAEGAYPIGFSDGDINEGLEQLQEAGLSLVRHEIPYPSGMLSAGGSGCCIQVYNQAPNPNAAKLFLNWWLSREGQTSIHNLEIGIDRQSLREDIPIGNVTDFGRRIEGRDYLFREADPEISARDAQTRDEIAAAYEASL